MAFSILGVALWSADYTQTTGQALVTARVVRHQPSIAWREYVYRGKGWRSLVSWGSAVLRLWRDIARRRAGTLYLVCSRSNGGFLRDVPALLVSSAGVRVVVHAHGSDIIDLLSSRRLSPFARTLYARCEIIVPSTHLVEPLRKLTPAPIHLCENYFAGGSDEKAGKFPPMDGPLTVLWNSNVMASKGFFDLAKAIQQVRGEGLAVRLVSVGQPLGDEEMTGQEAARRLSGLSVDEWFDYRGKVNQSTAITLTTEADIVALPSRMESQGIAVIEGMCAGKAIIVSDIPALRATLRDYPAYFVPVRSVEAIADALRDLYRRKMANPEAFASSLQEAAAVARRRFSAERFDCEMTAILLTAYSSSGAANEEISCISSSSSPGR